MSIVNSNKYISGICCYIIKLMYKENILSAQKCFWLGSLDWKVKIKSMQISREQFYFPSICTLKVFTLILRVNAFLLLDAYVK